MREVPVSSAFLAFPPVVARPLVFGNGLNYFALIINGSSSLVKPRRDTNATWRSGALCREWGWSYRRLLHELRQGLPYRTFPPGYTVNWHAVVAQTFDPEAVPIVVDGPEVLNTVTVAVEVQPPTDAPSLAPQRQRKPPTVTPVKQRRKSSTDVKRWRQPPPKKDIKDALAGIREAEPKLSGEGLETALCERLEGMTRQKARNAIKRYAPETVKLRGRPRKNNSPE